MKKILTIILLSLGVFLWYHGHSLDPGMGPVPQNPDQANQPQNMDPGVQQPPPQNPDQANQPQNMDPGVQSPPPQNPNQAGSADQNQSANSGPWICGRDSGRNCEGLCNSSGFDYAGTSSSDASTVKQQCPGGNWGIACQCKPRNSQ